MKKILILGTGSAQKDIIEYCSNRDYYVITTSNVKGYSAEKLADEFRQIDITNIQETEKLAREKNVDFIYSVGSDVAMPTIAKASDDLNLPCFISYNIALVCNHKYMLRKLLEDKNVDGNIPYQIIENIDEDINISFPAVMKPSDSQGQRGVYKVDNIEELKEHFSDSLSFSREKKVIVEQYIDGDEISVNVFLENGDIRFYLISDRIVWSEYPGGLIKEHVIPSKYEKYDEIVYRIRKLVEETIQALGIENGPVYYQIKIDKKGKPHIIEITPRLDGCHMWRAIKYCTGVDLLEASINLLEGKSYDQPSDYTVEPHSLEFLCGVPGSEFNKSNYTIPDNEFLKWYYEDGQTINRMNGYFEKCGYVIKKGSK